MINPDMPLLPSLLDRLMDDHPERQQDPPRSRAQNLTALQDSIRRDLEALLNTRRRCISPPGPLKDLDTSLIEYGVPDFLSVNAASDNVREELRSALESVIRRFEPRFKSFSVKLVDDTDQIDRAFRFRIDALMYAEPAPEYVSFDSTLNPGNHSFSVTGRRNG
jgi:type VI secretion system protein ImpF